MARSTGYVLNACVTSAISDTKTNERTRLKHSCRLHTSCSMKREALRTESDTSHTVMSFGLRSEEHTSELQSRLHLVCRLLLEKKNKTRQRYSRTRRPCTPSLPPRRHAVPP